MQNFVSAAAQTGFASDQGPHQPEGMKNALPGNVWLSCLQSKHCRKTIVSGVRNDCLIFRFRFSNTPRCTDSNALQVSLPNRGDWYFCCKTYPCCSFSFHALQTTLVKANAGKLHQENPVRRTWLTGELPSVFLWNEWNEGPIISLNGNDGCQ